MATGRLVGLNVVNVTAIGETNAVDTTSFPYGQIIEALRAGGSIAHPDITVRITACASNAAGVQLVESSVYAQGGSAVLDHTAGVWQVVNVGGDVCDFGAVAPSATEPTRLRQRATCDKIGWTK